MRFCDVCESRLEDKIEGAELYYQCTHCRKKFESSVEDTLRYELVYDDDDDSLRYDMLLKHAAFDVVNPKEHKPCPKCKKEITSYIVAGDDMRYMYACTCGHTFQ